MEALLQRHAAHLRRPELLKAIRALSVRYVEQRQSLTERSPLDTAGKRAAFAVYYAPLHFLTVRAIVETLHLHEWGVRRLIDLGSGTGVASAAWAVASPSPVDVHGVDAHPWAVTESAWTWRTLGVRGRATRADLLRTAATLSSARDLRETAIVAGWSVNELAADARRRLAASLARAAGAGAAILIVEPIGRRIVPWWNEWTAPFLGTPRARVDEWRLEHPLPPALDALREAAGFRADALTARSLAVAPHAV